MATLLPDQEGLRKASHELDALPDDWLISIDGNKRICFQKGPTGQPTYTHPTLGDLPRPWILRFCLDTEGKRMPRYFNTEITRTRTDNPRHDRKLLKKEAEAQKRMGLGASSTVLKMSKTLPLSAYKREPVKDKSIRNEYHIVKIVDDGQGDLGAMNAGVFVVKNKAKPNLLAVEKRLVASPDLTRSQTDPFQGLNRRKFT
jgi:NIMA (never in mitosis gene a)-related kinase